jgi:hypothetical protein
MQESNPKEKKKAVYLKKFVFNFFLNDEEYRNATETNSNMTKNEFSYLLYKTILRILQLYNKKLDKQKFFKAIFSVLKEQNIKNDNVDLYVNSLYAQLDFFDQQTLNIYLTYYLHNEPKGTIIKGVSFRRLLEEMIENGIINNRKFLSKGLHLVEKLTSNVKEQEILKNVMEAFIFNNDINLDSLMPDYKKSLSKQQLIKKLEECEKKINK